MLGKGVFADQGISLSFVREREKEMRERGEVIKRFSTSLFPTGNHLVFFSAQSGLRIGALAIWVGSACMIPTYMSFSPSGAFLGRLRSRCLSPLLV